MQEKNENPESWEKIIQHVAELENQYHERSGKLVSELMADHARREKRMLAVIIALVVAFVATNGYWIYQWNSYDYISQDGQGYNYYNSDIEGDVNNGAENQTEEDP